MEISLKICSIGMLSIFLLAQPRVTLRIPKPVVLVPPEIWLSSYYEADTFRGIPPDKEFRSQDQFQNDFVSKNGSDYVIFDDTRAVKFTCEADYPVTWKFPFPQQFDYTTFEDISSRHIRLSDFTVDTPDPLNTRFKTAILISISLVNFLSANLTCSSVENRHSQMESSIYVFLSTDKMAIENKGETLHVYLEPQNQRPFVLPCRPANPDMKLSLEKDTPTATLMKGGIRTVLRTEWRRVNAPEKYLSFDPKIGFTLQRGLVGDRIFGLYRCSVLTSSDDGGEIMDPNQFVLVNVSKSDSSTGSSEDHERMPFESRSFLHGDASVSLEPPTTAAFPRLICCSGVKNNPPNLFVRECNSPLKCELLKETAMELLEPGNEHELQMHNTNSINGLDVHFLANISSDCSSTLISGVSSVAVCKGTNVEFVEQYVNMFHPLAGGNITGRSGRIREADKLNTTGNDALTTSLSRFEPSATAKSAPTSQKILLTVGRQVRKPTNKTAQFFALPIYFISPKYYSNLGDTYGQNVFTSAEDLAIKLDRASIRMLEYHRDVYYVGEPLTFMCFGLKHFYTKKPHLRLNWSNGTKTLLDLQEQSANQLVASLGTKRRPRILYLNNNDDMFSGSGASLVQIFGNPVIASEEMSSVDCWMPLVNSSKWDKISKPVKVLPSVAPRFLEGEAETLYYYLGDVEHKVDCTLDIGFPEPAVAVVRDGRTVMFHGIVIIGKANETKAGKGDNSKAEDTVEKVGDLRVLSINIDFGNVTHEHQTVIQCLARNVNGTAKRTVTIYVLDKPSIALPIFLGIGGVLCALLVALGLKHWRDKRTVTTLRANSNL